MMNRWIAAGNKTTRIVEHAMDYDLTNVEQIVIFGAPDKYERVNMMKTGIKQILRYGTGNPDLKANSPVRIEENSDTRISFRKISDDLFEIEASNARFMPFGSPTRAVILNEKIERQGEDFDIVIWNDFIVNSDSIVNSDFIVNSDSNPNSNNSQYENTKVSKVTIRFKSRRPGVSYKYYNGRIFVDIF